MINSDKIAATMLNLAKKIISGEEIQKVKYRVTVEIPEELADTLEELSEQLDMTTQDLLGKFASEGLDTKLSSMVEQTKQILTPRQPVQADTMIDQLKDMGIDFSGIMDQLKHLRSLAGDLQGLQKVVENAIPRKATNNGNTEGSDNTNKSSKDSV